MSKFIVTAWDAKIAKVTAEDKLMEPVHITPDTECSTGFYPAGKTQILTLEVPTSTFAEMLKNVVCGTIALGGDKK